MPSRHRRSCAQDRLLVRVRGRRVGCHTVESVGSHEARVTGRSPPAIREPKTVESVTAEGRRRPSLEFQSGSSTQGMAFSRGVGLSLKEKNTRIESRPAVFPIGLRFSSPAKRAHLPLSFRCPPAPCASSHCLVAPARNFLDRVLSHNCVTPIGPFAEGRHAVVAFAELGRRRRQL
jgi:hypothetical protein